jgi:hypothetical protein
MVRLKSSMMSWLSRTLRPPCRDTRHIVQRHPTISNCRQVELSRARRRD